MSGLKMKNDGEDNGSWVGKIATGQRRQESAGEEQVR